VSECNRAKNGLGAPAKPILAMGWDVVLMAIHEIYLDEAIERMCRKYGIIPERYMKEALLERIHAAAIAARPWQSLGEVSRMIEVD